MNQEDIIRKNTPGNFNQKIDENILETINKYSIRNEEDLTEKIIELEREWDIERKLELNASTLSLIGLVLGFTVNKKWFAMPAVVTSFLLLHSIQGWCPPLPIFRKIGVRSRKEIEKEKYALKYLRGDFDFSGKTNQTASKRILDALEK